MNKTETITRAINFRQVGAVMERTRCLDRWVGDYGVVNLAPSSIPHRWFIAEHECEFGAFGGNITRTKFQCAFCDDTVYEERPYRDGDMNSTYAPETVLNWDGSPPVMAQ